MRISRTPIAATAAVLLLAGCGGGGQASDPEPVIPSSSSADPSPTEPTQSDGAGEAPVMPQAAKERTAEGVEAFVQHWGDAVTYAGNTGDVRPLQAISDSGCGSCNGALNQVTDLYDAGGSLEAAGWEVRQVGYASNMPISQPVVRFRRGLEIVRQDGERPQRFEADAAVIQFDLQWRGSGWAISDYTVVN